MSLMSEGDDFFKTLSSAVTSQAKNREKNRKRKERAEHRKSVQDPADEPDSKKAKTKPKGNIIVTTPEQRKELEQFFHSTAIYNGALKIAGVFTSSDGAINYFYFYPLVLGPNRDAEGNVKKRKKPVKGTPIKKAEDYIPAAGNPTVIFTILTMAFAKLFPDKEGSIRKWDIWRLNTEYYGPKVAGQAMTPKAYLATLGESKPFGGARTLKSVHLVEDIRVSRFTRAIHVKDYFEELKKFDLHGPIPGTARTLAVDILKQIRANTVNEKEAEAKAEKEVEKAVGDKSFASNAAAQDESDYESEDYESE